MSYIYNVREDYRAGIPQTPTGTIGPFLMIAEHDTEGGTGDAGAIGTIYFLIDRADRNASYHELWAWDEGTRIFRVRRIVPPTSAAHSVNPFPPSKGGSYEPDATVRAALGARVNDPNRVIYAVSIAGTKADVNRWSTDPDFVAACKRRIAEIRKELNIPDRRAEHFRFNPSTRSDWGTLLTPALNAQGDMPVLSTYAVEKVVLDKDARVRSAPSAGPVERSFLTPSDRYSTVTRIGTLVNADGEWSVYWVYGWNAWGYTLKQNIVSVEPISEGASKEELDSLKALLDEKNAALDRIDQQRLPELQAAVTAVQAALTSTIGSVQWTRNLGEE